MSELPSHDLQLKAADERRRLHNSVAELRAKVHDEFALQKLVRDRLGAICGISAIFALGLGFVITGAFVRH